MIGGRQQDRPRPIFGPPREADALRKLPRSRSRRTAQGGRIAAFAQEVRACVLGRAAAAVLGAHAIGRSRAVTEAVRDRLRAMLEIDGDPPAAPFEQLAILRVARTHKSRHASILLPLQATLDALSAYRSQAKADPDPHRRQPKRSLRLVPGPPAWR